MEGRNFNIAARHGLLDPGYISKLPFFICPATDAAGAARG